MDGPPRRGGNGLEHLAVTERSDHRSAGQRGFCDPLARRSYSPHSTSNARFQPGLRGAGDGHRDLHARRAHTACRRASRGAGPRRAVRPARRASGRRSSTTSARRGRTWPPSAPTACCQGCAGSRRTPMRSTPAREPIRMTRACARRWNGAPRSSGCPSPGPDDWSAGARGAMRMASLAEELGCGAGFVLAATRLAFCGGYDLDDPEILAEAAAAAGLDLELALCAAGEIRQRPGDGARRACGSCASARPISRRRSSTASSSPASAA